MKSPSFQYYAELFNEEETNQLAKETGFMKRFRSINGFNFLMNLVFYGGSLAISLRGLRESFFFKKILQEKGYLKSLLKMVLIL